MKFSDQQSDIIKCPYNIICNAVAGSGKTTTILGISKAHKDKNILLLTYNRKLMDETIERRDSEGIYNLSIFTYHSCAGSYFEGGPCMNDSILCEVLSRNQLKVELDYDIIILDEVQDMRFQYFYLVKLLCGYRKPERMCLFGDERQTIYDYGKLYTDRSDGRFLTMGSQIFKDMVICDKWEEKKLNVTWRLTPEMCSLLNSAFIKKRDYLISGKPPSNIKPEYYMCDLYKPYEIVNLIVDLIEEKHYKQDDIFILASSTTSDDCVAKKIETYMHTKYNTKYSFYVSNDDDRPINDESSKGKITISTFHKTKGLERKVIIFLNLDMTQTLYYKHNNNEYLSNKFYVGLTRAKERLYIFHNFIYDHLKLTDTDQLSQHANVYGTLKIQDHKGNNIIKREISQMVRNVSQSKLRHIENYFNILYIRDPEVNIKFTPKITPNYDKELIEETSAVNGIAIPLYFAFKDTMSIEDILRKAIKFRDDHSGYLELGRQIDHYDWVTKDDFMKFNDIMSEILGKNNKFEDDFERHIMIDKKTYNILGARDMVDEDKKIIWEFKCTQRLKIEDAIQCALYAKDGYEMRLINLLTNETWQVVIEEKMINDLIIFLLDDSQDPILTDKEFLDETRTFNVNRSLIPSFKSICNHVFIKGKRKGQRCGNIYYGRCYHRKFK